MWVVVGQTVGPGGRFGERNPIVDDDISINGLDVDVDVGEINWLRILGYP